MLNFFKETFSTRRDEKEKKDKKDKINLEKDNKKEKQEQKPEKQREISKNIREGVIAKVDNYIKFLNEIEEKKEILKGTDFDFEEMEKVVENNLIKLIEKVNQLDRSGKFSLIVHSSLEDVIGNSILMEMALVNKKSKEKEVDFEKLKKYANNLKKSLKDINYYTDVLCNDKEKLEMELERRNGYLEKFAEYFIDIETQENGQIVIKKKYPTGIKKVAYFRFFNEWEKGKINLESLEKKLDKLDEDFVNKTKIREKFKKEKI